MEEENIELRSEKVRGIIGEIPHAIIRVGISVLFFVMLLLLFVCYLIKVPTLVECDVTERQGDKLLITTDKMHEISVNNTFELKYNDVVIYSDTVKGIEKTTIIERNKVLYKITATLPDTVKMNGKDIVINDYSSLKATIKTGETRLFYKYFPFLETK